MILREMTVAIALGEEGQRERSRNWSDRIKEYLAAADISVPAPWCAAFCAWCSDQAASVLKVPNPLEDVVREGLVADYHKLAHERGWIVPHAEAQLGDLVIFDFPGGNRWDHIGFVIVPPRDGTGFLTIEGNTDDAGGREGIKVARRSRSTTQYPVVFARWDPDIEPDVEMVESVRRAA